MKAARPLATRPARSSRPAGASTSRGADNQARAALPAASSSSSGWEGSDCATSRHLDTHRSGMTLSAEGAANHAPSNRCSTQAGGQAAAPVGAGAAPIAHTEGSSNGGWSPRKVPPAQRPSAALAPLPAAAIPAPSGATAQVQGRPVPLLQLHKLQEQPQQQQQQSGSKPGSRPYSRAAAVVQPKHLANPAQPPPHLAASLSARLPTGRAAPTRAAAAALAFRGAATARGPERGLPLLPTAAGAVPAQGRAGPPALEYGGSEAEAQRAQQMVGWAALLLQAAAAVAAERVLLGPAARPVSRLGAALLAVQRVAAAAGARLTCLDAVPACLSSHAGCRPDARSPGAPLHCQSPLLCCMACRSQPSASKIAPCRTASRPLPPSCRWPAASRRPGTLRAAQVRRGSRQPAPWRRSSSSAS
jgi:hypothetical protein